MKTLADLNADPRNPRSITAESLHGLTYSIAEFGDLSGITFNTRTKELVCGHQRVKAIRSQYGDLEIAKDTIKTPDGHHFKIRTVDWPKSKQLAANVAANAPTIQGEFTDDLQGILSDIQTEEPLAFEELDLGSLLAEVEAEPMKGNTDPDDVPETPADPVTKLGDVWLLGRHRVMCGDSTDLATVEQLMDGKKADICLTDPPYGLGDTKSVKNDYETYNDTKENLVELVGKFLPLAQKIASVVVLTPGTTNHRVYPAPTWTMAWFTPAGIGCGPWGFCCWQPILCYGKDPKLAKGKGSHPDAIVHTEASEKLGHPCTKPINFWKWLMERTGEVGELVYEPFVGSGTTIIAAEQLERTCYGMELDPRYCDVIVRRWQDFTGQQATLEATGELFDDLTPAE